MGEGEGETEQLMTICLRPLAQIHYLFTIPRDCCSPLRTTKLLPPQPRPHHHHLGVPIHPLEQTNSRKWNLSEKISNVLPKVEKG